MLGTGSYYLRTYSNTELVSSPDPLRPVLYVRAPSEKP